MVSLSGRDVLLRTLEPLSRHQRGSLHPGLEKQKVTSRISDLRVQQAQEHGRIVGLPAIFAQEVAALADFLTDCRIWSDVTLTFDGEVVTHCPGRWRVPVNGEWWILFNWLKGVGPLEMRLWREDDG